MAAVGRILLIIVVVLVVVVGAAFFLLPNSASRSETLDIARPASSVFARLASTPAGTTIAEGVTLTGVSRAENNTVVGDVAYADGATGRVTYSITPQGEGSRVRMRLERDLGDNLLARFGAIGGGPVSPLIDQAVASVSANLEVLPTSNFSGLQYQIVQVEARPFFYYQDCVENRPDSVVHIIREAASIIPEAMRINNVQAAGPLIALEPRVMADQYCFQVGYPYSGRPARTQGLGWRTGMTPAGTQLRMVYTGTEEDVWNQIYDPLDALLAAAYLDDPSTTSDDWANYEVYHDDPTQPGGSRNREIFYIVPEGRDISAMTRIHPPVEVPAVSAPAAPATAPEPAAPAASEETPQPADATP